MGSMSERGIGGDSRAGLSPCGQRIAARRTLLGQALTRGRVGADLFLAGAVDGMNRCWSLRGDEQRDDDAGGEVHA